MPEDKRINLHIPELRAHELQRLEAEHLAALRAIGPDAIDSVRSFMSFLTGKVEDGDLHLHDDTASLQMSVLDLREFFEVMGQIQQGIDTAQEKAEAIDARIKELLRQ